MELAKKIGLFSVVLLCVALGYSSFQEAAVRSEVDGYTLSNLTPENNFRLELNDDLDAIFCIAVFEHLNNPMDTIKVFYETLRHNGLLFFDYVKSDGVGMDSKHSKTQRNDVIDFINKNFELVHGNISKDKDMGFTIVKKG